MSDYPKPPVREAKKRERSKDRDDSKSSDKKQKKRTNSEDIPRKDGRPYRSPQVPLSC